jgi:SulP family sulfate permease
VILEFSRVSRVDAAAIAAIRKLELLAATHEGRIVLAALNPAVGAEFERSGLVFGADLTLSRADDADSALQAEEERLLARDTSPASEDTALGALSRMIDDPQTARRLLDLLDREPLAPGEVLIRQGDRAGDVFIIDSGTMGVHIRMASGRVMRLRVLRSGALVGEIASYAGLPRTADVIAETEAVVYRASEERMREIAAHSPELAATLHRIVAATLAERLDRTNKLLGDLT